MIAKVTVSVRVTKPSVTASVNSYVPVSLTPVEFTQITKGEGIVKISAGTV